MQKRDEKLDALLQKIEDGAKAVFESENYKRMLSTMAKFHHYSVNNLFLIYFQKPDATAVAGYRAWQTKFHRNVMKGEKGIQIIGYTPKTVTVDELVKDERGVPVMGADGQPATQRVQKQIPAYTAMYVFDVSQTEGEPLPTIGPKELQGDVRRYTAIREALLELSPVPVVFEAFPSAAKGKMDHEANLITVQPGMSEVQTIKTLVHEIAHAQMHDWDDGLSRNAKEVEAESVAFVTCEYLGIDTSDYSFPYVAGWAGDKELKVLQASLNRIRSQAAENIEKLDAALEKVPEQTKEKSPEELLAGQARELGLVDEDVSALQKMYAEHKQRNGQAVKSVSPPEPAQDMRQPAFADRLSMAQEKAAAVNARRMAMREPVVQEAEIGRRK